MFTLKRKSSLVVIVLLIAGALLIAYGSWQVIHSKTAQAKALDIAKSKTQFGLEKVAPTQEFPEVIEEGEVFGILQIPQLEAELPIIEGTGDKELEQGVGHFIGTALPGLGDQIVLSGHRDTVFQHLGDLVIGDQIIFEMHNGTFTYEVKSTDIVDADDRTVIRTTAPNEVLTLTTCYPFHFVGNAPERYIVYAEPVL
ncbi:class D sortase [Robertmurraya massiliosenegalensis]|uniref:class D sortase n=1 Tax=Robertmurraya massiliosenegalensis TaxID=1287657 RepID=UPI0002DC4855|nr:class D sortase [Robertmurraya massiliosenegalensis]